MKAILIFLFFFVVYGCTKHDNSPGKLIFYKTNIDSRWSAIIDGTEYGEIPYTIIEPPCDYNETLGLIIKVSPGEHTVDYKSLDGYAWGSPKKITVSAGGCQTVWAH